MTRLESSRTSIKYYLMREHLFISALISSMRGSAIKCHQIFYSIISFNTVDMMDILGALKRSTEIFLNNKTVFKFVFVDRNPFNNISKRMKILSTIPIMIIFSNNPFVTGLKFCFYKITRFPFFCKTHFFKCFDIMLFPIERIICSEKLHFISYALTFARAMFPNPNLNPRWSDIKFFRTYTTCTFNHEVII